jgi:outer membrane protein
MTTRQLIAVLLAATCAAQEMEVTVQRPRGSILTRPYKPTTVPPVLTHNSNRMHDLIRAGKLYLTAQDAIALAIENNLDLEVDRYGPLAAEWAVERAEAGGVLPGVTGRNQAVNQVTGGQGVVGSEQTAGVASSSTGGGQSTGGAIINQIGPITPNLDAVLQNTSAFSHTTTPQPELLASQTVSLVDTRHIFNTFVQQGLVSGGYVQVTANESYLNENAPSDVINPSVAPVVQVFARHNFLQGFGVAVNSRFIRVAKRNVQASNETFQSQLLNLVANVLNLYWDLVSDQEDLKARQLTLDVAKKFYEGTKKEIEIGAIAKVDIYRAEAEFNTREREQAISLATIRQQENLLKNALSRNGLEDPELDQAEVVPLDSIQVPESEDLPPLRELLARALAKRPDVRLAKINDGNGEILALGTANGILPQLQGTGVLTAHGLAGAPNAASGEAPAPGSVGGLGTALGQVFRGEYRDRRGALLFVGTLGNRVAQGDYGVDQLQLRQGDLIERRNLNQIVVDISNQMVALRQARARFATARDTRALQEQLLEKEQQKFQLGSSTLDDVIAVQRSLSGARSIEVATLATFSRARVSLDQVLGETLEKNHVSVSEALGGRLNYKSNPPNP